MANLFATKPLKTILAEAHETGEHSLRRALGPTNLITLGIARSLARESSSSRERRRPNMPVRPLFCLLSLLRWAACLPDSVMPNSRR